MFYPYKSLKFSIFDQKGVKWCTKAYQVQTVLIGKAKECYPLATAAKVFNPVFPLKVCVSFKQLLTKRE